MTIASAKVSTSALKHKKGFKKTTQQTEQTSIKDAKPSFKHCFFRYVKPTIKKFKFTEDLKIQCLMRE